VGHVAALLEIDPNTVDVDKPFRSLGLDSIAAVDLSAKLEDWLGCELSPTVSYDYPTIAKLSEHVVSLRGGREAAE
jgi:acyl carrier protein